MCVRKLNSGDPMAIRAQIALKMALNAHSTGVMACLGKVLTLPDGATDRRRRKILFGGLCVMSVEVH
jgi:hypothetical protein